MIVVTLDITPDFAVEKIRGVKCGEVDVSVSVELPVLSCVATGTLGSVLSGNSDCHIVESFVVCSGSGSIGSVLAGVSICETVAPAIVCIASGTLGSVLGGSSSCRYDANVARPLSVVCQGYSQDAVAISCETIAANRQPVPASSIMIVRQSDATARLHSIAATVNKTAFLRIQSAETVADARQTIASLQVVINNTDFLATLLVTECGNAIKVSYRIDSKINQTQFLNLETNDTVQDAFSYKYTEYLRIYERVNKYNPHLIHNVADFDVMASDADVPFLNSIIKQNSFVDFIGSIGVGCHSVAVSTGNYAIQPLLKKISSDVQRAISPQVGKRLAVDSPRPPPTPQPDNHQTLIISTRRIYTMQHVITVVTLLDHIPISLDKINLKYDVDSYAWVFSGSLANKADLVHVTPVNDEPVQLSITINSHNFVMLVEKIPETKSFGKTAITLNGRSLSAKLGTPYQLLNSVTVGSDMDVQQIAASLLPYGWTLNWQCATPWLVPANTYSHTQQSPLQALAALAQNIGAVLKPSRNNQTITFQPRYPISPWDYNATGINPDLIIPDSAIESIGLESRTQSVINAVYVHGEHNGVLAWCRLNGTAGDVLAPTQNNPLITDVTAARALGERLLAGQATQPLTKSVTTWLGGDFPLADVGWLVEVNGERATVNGVEINAVSTKDSTTVRQTLSFGENTNNPYSKLLYLLPTSPLLVGKVASVYGDNAILTLLDGGVITARGTGVVGKNYYVRNGLIESDAPDLVLNEVVI